MTSPTALDTAATAEDRRAPTAEGAQRAAAARRRRARRSGPWGWAPATAAALMLSLGLSGGPAHAQTLVIDTDERRVYAIEGDWALYRSLVEDAITQEGMVINTVGHIAAMLERTGGEVGGETIYREGEALEFCSAVYSRRMMEADPHAIVFCPYVIAIYELEAEPGTVYIGYQKAPLIGDDASRKALEDVNALLERVVQGALTF